MSAEFPFQTSGSIVHPSTRYNITDAGPFNAKKSLKSKDEVRSLTRDKKSLIISAGGRPQASRGFFSHLASCGLEKAKQTSFGLYNRINPNSQNPSLKGEHKIPKIMKRTLVKSKAEQNIPDLKHKLQIKKYRRNRKGISKIFSPINENMDINGLKQFKIKNKKDDPHINTFDNIKFIGTNNDLDFDLGLSGKQIKTQQIKFEDEADDVPKIPKIEGVDRLPSPLEEKKESSSRKQPLEPFVSEDTVFKDSLMDTQVQALKFKSQIYYEHKENTARSIDRNLINKRHHTSNYYSNIANLNSSHQTTYDERNKQHGEVQLDTSEKVGLDTARNQLNPDVCFDTFYSENKTIISKKSHPIDKFFKQEKSIISRDVRNLTAMPSERDLKGSVTQRNKELNTQRSRILSTQRGRNSSTYRKGNSTSREQPSRNLNVYNSSGKKFLSTKTTPKLGSLVKKPIFRNKNHKKDSARSKASRRPQKHKEVNFNLKNIEINLSKTAYPSLTNKS
ncbi:unnamed protein product [Moneuplotes crassus]|uniref:Uncharacterized protein n=1 Tax=Euplotes crassus TaxID=5936 RepID=A0AAD1U0S2_EUPCR|nr:unnamed protein product [Moneuplotes crassus]